MTDVNIIRKRNGIWPLQTIKTLSGELQINQETVKLILAEEFGTRKIEEQERHFEIDHTSSPRTSSMRKSTMNNYNFDGIEIPMREMYPPLCESDLQPADLISMQRMA
ncbi:hypothetical protein Trydic_g14772 [Trypoxylus dichotomus]